MIVFNDFILVEPTLEKQHGMIHLVDIVDKNLRKGTIVGVGCNCRSEEQMLLGKEVIYAVSGGFAGFGDPVRLDLNGKRYDLITEKQLVMVKPPEPDSEMSEDKNE